jgi:hypothetical protein
LHLLYLHRMLSCLPCFPPPGIPSWHPGTLCRKGKCLYRIGEAANPGPTIVSANLSSLSQGWADLAALRWDIALVPSWGQSARSAVRSSGRPPSPMVNPSSPSLSVAAAFPLYLRCLGPG